MIKPIVILLSLTFSSFSFAEETKGLNLFGENSSSTKKQPVKTQMVKPLKIFGENSTYSKEAPTTESLNNSSKPSVSKLGDNFFITNPNGSKLICYKEISDKTCEAVN